MQEKLAAVGISFLSLIMGASALWLNYAAKGWFAIAAVTALLGILMPSEIEEEGDRERSRDEDVRFAKGVLLVLGITAIVIGVNGVRISIPFSEWGIAIGLSTLASRNLIRPIKRGKHEKHR